MAKWGEGDPRWLVEDRPDATNVNNWHWTEKNASHWSKNKLTELLVGLKLEDKIGTCEITEMNKCEGDAAVNNRKGKLIFFYEWSIELKWKGIPKDDDVLVTGSFDILNLSEEHEIKDVDIVVNIDKTCSEAEKFKDLLRLKGTELIRKQLSTYLMCLKEEFSRGVILPTKDSGVSPPRVKVLENTSKKKITEAVTTKNNLKPKTCEVGELQSTETFKCTADEFYRVLTTKEMVQAFTQGDCVLNAVKGGKFELYGGNVQGQFTELVPNQVIKQRWRFKSWPEGHFSDVSIEIKEKTDCTEVYFHQKGVPESELSRTSDGWKRYYWENIKRVFGFGTLLF